MKFTNLRNAAPLQLKTSRIPPHTYRLLWVRLPLAELVLLSKTSDLAEQSKK